MFGKKSNLFISLVVILAVVFTGCSSKMSFDDWEKQNLVWQDWAAPIEVELDEDTKYASFSPRNVFEIEEAHENIAQLRFLTENTKPSEENPNYYDWMYQLGDGLLKAGEYHLAYHYLTKVLELPNDTLIRELKEDNQVVKETKADANLDGTIKSLILKILAAKGYKEEFKTKYQSSEYANASQKSSDAPTVAIALGLIDDKEEAYKVFEYAINPDNFKSKSKIKTASSNIGAAAYAYKNGDYDKVFELTDRFIKEGIDSKNPIYFEGNLEDKSAFPVNQWKSSFKQTEAYRELATKAKNAQVADFKGLKDGEYTSSVISYMQTPVNVAITVKSGKVSNVKASQDKPQDDRSGAAFGIVAQRIIDKQSVDVDTVSTATISSEAVKIGVLESLLKAK